MKKLMWTNIFSGETGYVKAIRKSKSYFENTADISEARAFRSVKECETAIALLTELGEAKNNTFTIVEE